MNDIRRVLGIVASPHDSGNTARLVMEVLRGAEENGYGTEMKCLGTLNINPVVASVSDEESIWSRHSNKPYGVSMPTDDMEQISSSLEKMSVLVFGTPIYYDHVSARAKIFIDRLIQYQDRRANIRFPRNVRAIIIVTFEWEKPEAYSGVVNWLKHTFEAYFKMKVVASLQAENTVKNPVINRTDLLQKAHQIGRNL